MTRVIMMVVIVIAGSLVMVMVMVMVVIFLGDIELLLGQGAAGGRVMASA